MLIENFSKVFDIGVWYGAYSVRLSYLTYNFRYLMDLVTTVPMVLTFVRTVFVYFWTVVVEFFGDA